MIMTREEVLIGTGPTSATYVRCKIGAKRDGTIVAGEAYLAYEAGAFPGSPVGAGAGCMFSSYDIPNLVTDAYDVITNKPKVSAYRAPGSPQGTYAVESLIDELAERLEIEPMDGVAPEGTDRLVPQDGNAAGHGDGRFKFRAVFVDARLEIHLPASHVGMPMFRK